MPSVTLPHVQSVGLGHLPVLIRLDEPTIAATGSPLPFAGEGTESGLSEFGISADDPIEYGAIEGNLSRYAVAQSNIT